VEEGPKVALDLNRALRSAVQMGAHQVRQRAQLAVELGPLPVVRANDGRLCQVFLNLVLNAAQAIRPGAPEANRVHVRSWSREGLVYTSIRDTGEGIEGRHLGRIFDPFFSTKSSSASSSVSSRASEGHDDELDPQLEGTGLGLWICREIVHEYGGHIDVESEAGAGSTFTVVLPAASGAVRGPSSAPPPRPFDLAPVTFPFTLTMPGHRILVVDDEPALRDLLAEALSERAQVLTAANGSEARELLEHDAHFDVILCDLMMPAMNGVDLFEHLEREHPALAERMVFMTGAPDTPRSRALLARVANECLSKPFRVKEVERILDRVLDASGYPSA
jgi:CheY-like chemotaxis protein